MIKVHYTCGVCNTTAIIEHFPGSAMYKGVLTDVAGVHLCRDCCKRAVELLIKDESRKNSVHRLDRSRY